MMSLKNLSFGFALFWILGFLNIAACSSDSTGMQTDALPESCTEGEERCWNGRLATCLTGGSNWAIEDCSEGLVCIDDHCVQAECVPGSTQCKDNGVQTCSEDGHWGETQPCEVGLGCVDGHCSPSSCEPGDRLCGIDTLMVCQEDGLTWKEEPCAEGQLCFQGQCVDCVSDRDCGTDASCQNGECLPKPLSIITPSLPDGLVGEQYTVSLESQGGERPHEWQLISGALPQGLTLSEQGEITGIPESAGDFSITVEVKDQSEVRVQAAFDLIIHSEGLVITTDHLPNAEDGLEYSSQLQALGGTPPYIWSISSGTLPQGLSLSSTGEISGIPNEIGDFPITVRAFDSLLPPNYDERSLSLTVTIAPLEIIGDQEYDLFVTKVIVLPMMTIIDGLPLPYSAQLQAKGGLRPYHWQESELNGGLQFLIPRSGIPEGLTLSEDGSISGSVSDTSQVVDLDVPMTDINLTGFFFMAEVNDSQDPPDHALGLFLIPTVPIGGQ